MNTVAILAEIIGSVFVLSGLVCLNKKSITAAMSGLESNKGLTLIVGLMTFLMGAVVVALDNTWNSGWQIVIPIIGWLIILKGLFITLFPNTSTSFYGKVASTTLVMVAGVVAVLIGLVLFYLGMTA